MGEPLQARQRATVIHVGNRAGVLIERGGQAGKVGADPIGRV